ncbi:MAG: hypothetical protein AAF797_17370 [Planctomycetota bacterium]
MIVSHHRHSESTPILSKAPPQASATDKPGLPPSVTAPSESVRRARRLLQMGLLDTPERLDAAIDKLFDAEFTG